MAAKEKDASKDTKEQKIGSNISHESMRVVAESIGITSLPDEAASFLSEQVTYYLKTIVQVGKTSISSVLKKQTWTQNII